MIKLLRQILIAFVGGTVLLIGIALIVLPGPAILVIPAGLAILAIEFAWARHWLNRVKSYLPGRKGTEALSSSDPKPQELGK